MQTQTFNTVAAVVVLTLGDWQRGQRPRCCRGRGSRGSRAGVAAIQRSQVVWYEDEQQVCGSCHHQFQPAIAFAVARAHGVAVNEAVATTNARSFGLDVDAALQFDNVIEPALQEGYRLLAAHAAGIEPSLGTSVMARFLIARQRPAGDWSGLNQRPPSSSSDFAKTAFGPRCRTAVSSSRRCRSSPSYCRRRREVAEVASGSGH